MKVVISVLTLLTLAAPLASAADFWEKRPFPNWSVSDIQKMLTDSPWARPALVPRETLSREASDSEARTGGRTGCGSCAVTSSTATVESLRSPELQAPLAVVVRWLSALPVKQALVKLRFGEEAAGSQAAELLAQAEERYVVGISGLPAALLPDASEEIRSKAFLEIKNSAPIAAEDAAIRGEGQAVNLVLYFPRQRTGGEVISLSDREVTVALKLASVGIKRKFKLSDMVYQGKLEL
ncbi:MAG: hypothetical protein KIT09_04635 [Bryobacteraceae bacterium]|nr:hypothetical protein [Bryobacteraceae bacterium]